MIEEINNQKRKLVNLIKEYSKSQKEVWQKIPYFAIKANGRNGWNGKLSFVGKYGYWQLDDSINHGHYRAFIDCENGNIVSASNPKIDAYEHVIIKLLPENLDASIILKDLIEESKSDVKSYMRYTKEFLYIEHNKIIDEFQIKEKYQRLVPYKPNCIWD